jgi:hypothetical protein
MYSPSKTVTLVTLGLTAIFLSRALFVFFDDPEWEYGWEEPLRGLEIGERLAWFKAQRVFAEDDGDQWEAA